MPGRKKSIKSGKLKRIDAIAEQVSQTTKFNFSEARCLVLIHQKMETIGPLNTRRFREFLQIIFDITDEVMLDFLFHYFDADNNGTVDEYEFCEGLSTMIRGTLDQLADFSYSIYDINGDGSLAREEVHHCIKGCIYPGFGIEEDEVEECEREITEMIMKKLDVDKDGLITKEDFRNAARMNPLLLNGLGQCLPSGQCRGAFLGTFSEKHRQYSADYPNVLDAIQRMDSRYRRGKGGAHAGGHTGHLETRASIMSDSDSNPGLLGSGKGTNSNSKVPDSKAQQGSPAHIRDSMAPARNTIRESTAPGRKSIRDSMAPGRNPARKSGVTA